MSAAFAGTVSSSWLLCVNDSPVVCDAEADAEKNIRFGRDVARLREAESLAATRGGTILDSVDLTVVPLDEESDSSASVTERVSAPTSKILSAVSAIAILIPSMNPMGWPP